MAVTDPSRHERAEMIFAAQVDLLFKNQPLALLATVANGTLVAYVFYSQAPAFLMLSWLIGMYSMSLVRFLQLRAYRRNRPSVAEAPGWAKGFFWGSLVNGCLWGVAGGMFVPENGYLHEVFMAFVLAGMGAGALSSNGAYKPAFTAFTVPALLPYALRVAFRDGEVFVAMSMMTALYVALMWVLCNRHNQAIIESLQLRFDNLALNDVLIQANREQAQANARLSAEIDDRHRIERALASCDHVYRTLIETTGFGYVLLDEHACVLDANEVYVKTTGHIRLDQIKGHSISEWTAPYDVERTLDRLRGCADSGAIQSTEFDYVNLQGKVLPVELNAMALHDGPDLRFVGVARDITERREAEQALRRAHDYLERMVNERTAELAASNESLGREKELFRVTLASIVDGVITTDALGNVTFMNAAAEQLTAWERQEAIGRPIEQVFHALDDQSRQVATNTIMHCLVNGNCVAGRNQYLMLREKEERVIEASAAPLRDSRSAIIGAVISFRDVTGQRRLAEQLAHEATHDKLTGLVNRHEFERRLQHALESANTNNPHALLYLDLDQFKVVNDTCGHSAGDELLRQVSRLLRVKIRARDTLARLGGDEFGVILQHCPLGEARRIAHTLREVIQNFRFGWQDKSFSLGVSIGLVAIASSDDTIEWVLSAADSACYAAKERGRNRVHIYELDDGEVIRRNREMRWLPRIQQALEDNRFCLYYQPIRPVGSDADTQTQREVLVRMIDEQGQIVPPGAFLPAAERYGQMLAIDEWVVGKTLATLAGPISSSGNVAFAINISGQSAGAPHFLDFVNESIDRYCITANRICFEITETAAVSELNQVLRFMEALKVRGCRFALDDFGTGLASFSYLKTLPVDYLKIDGCFVRDLVADKTDYAMVEAIHRIGHVMGLRTVAEWVQDSRTLDALAGIGVDYAQGYALGRPRPMFMPELRTPEISRGENSGPTGSA